MTEIGREKQRLESGLPESDIDHNIKSIDPFNRIFRKWNWNSVN